MAYSGGDDLDKNSGPIVQAARTSDPFTLKLIRFYNEKVAIPQAVVKEERRLMTEVSEQLFKFCQENENSVSQYYYAGSSYDGLQVANSGPNRDFDLLLAMNWSKDLEVDQVVPGYVRMKPKPTVYDKFKNYLNYQGYIVPEKFQKSLMFSLLHRAINSLNKINVWRMESPRLNGPAIRLDIKKGDVKISIDIVPTLKISENERYVAKPYKDYADEDTLPWGVEKTSLWRKAFSAEETQRFKNIDMDGGCRKQLLRILKAVRNKDATLRGLSSYHFKTLMLYENEKVRGKEAWQMSQMGARFRGMLQSLANSLETGQSLPNFFIREVDLYDGMSKILRFNIMSRARRLLSSEQELNKLLHVDAQGPPGAAYTTYYQY